MIVKVGVSAAACVVLKQEEIMISFTFASFFFKKIYLTAYFLAV
jgi:hypothetical protein